MKSTKSVAQIVTINIDLVIFLFVAFVSVFEFVSTISHPYFTFHLAIYIFPPYFDSYLAQ